MSNKEFTCFVCGVCLMGTVVCLVKGEPVMSMILAFATGLTFTFATDKRL